MSEMPSGGTQNIVDTIRDVFRRRGANSYLGERVTMSEHMLQCALLAERDSADDQLVAAALLHDIGHYTGEFPETALGDGIDNRHEEAGARVLAPYFPARVVDCVRWHVAAKRYLCAVEPGYFDSLSDASKHTLNLQGGPMTPSEVRRFASRPNLDAILKVRRFDEQAKVPGMKTPTFDHYADLLESLVATESPRTRPQDPTPR